VTFLENHIFQHLYSSSHGMSAADLWLKLPWWRKLVSGDLYPTLMRLERRGMIKSAWVDRTYPRRRLYHLNKRYDFEGIPLKNGILEITRAGETSRYRIVDGKPTH
jgi:hypothetical protein